MYSKLPDPTPSAESVRNPQSRRSITLCLLFFLGGFAVMLAGLIVQYNPVAGLGFVSMIVSFIYLNHRLFMRYGKNSLRRFTKSGRLTNSSRVDSWVFRN